MFVVILIMLAGVALGRYSRSAKLAKAAGRSTTMLVWALLFMLGIEVGSNPRITGSLATLGVEAAVLALFATAGSVVSAWALWRWAKPKGAKQ